MRSPGTTNDRITVHIAEDTTPAELQRVAQRVAASFDLSSAEAEALLKADVILLERGEAETLVAICRSLGIRGKMVKPKPPVSRTVLLGRQTLPWLLALLGAVVLVTLLSLVLPEVSVSSDANPVAPPEAAPSEAAPSGVALSETAAEPAPDLPIIATAETTDETTTETTATDAAPQADAAVPRIASTTATDAPGDEVVGEAGDEQQTPPSLPVIPSAPAADVATDVAVDIAADPAADVSAESAAPPDLFTAARDSDLAAVERALVAARRVDVRDAYGQTPLMYAAGANSRAVVAALVAAGAEVNATSDAGWTPLMYAARNTNDPAVVKTLLAAGADPLALNESGQGARDIALAYNNSAAAAIPAPARREADARPAPETRPETLLLPRVAEPVTAPAASPAVSPVAAAPAVGGGRPITITPRPLPTLTFPPPVPVQRVPIPTAAAPGSASGQAVPSQVVPSPAPSAPTVPQEPDIILDCLQNWDACGN